MTDHEGWRLADTTNKRRALLAQAVRLHRKKGTPWSILDALDRIGYPGCSLLEHKDIYTAWLAAGGEILDGVGFIDGSNDLSAPGGEFRFTTSHWAQYSIRVNLADDGLSPARQREIMDVAREYAPARCHLVALVAAVLAQWDAHIDLDSVTSHGRARFDACKRHPVPSFDTLDGCGLLDGETLADALDGFGALDGGLLDGFRISGEPLNGGQIGYAISGRARYFGVAAGGDVMEPPETLDAGIYLDGARPISGPLLDGRDAIDGRGDLDYPTLSSIEDFIDGASNLGYQLGIPGIWHGGRVTVRRGSLIYQETLQ